MRVCYTGCLVQVYDVTERPGDYSTLHLTCFFKNIKVWEIVFRMSTRIAVESLTAVDIGSK